MSGGGLQSLSLQSTRRLQQKQQDSAGISFHELWTKKEFRPNARTAGPPGLSVVRGNLGACLGAVRPQRGDKPTYRLAYIDAWLRRDARVPRGLPAGARWSTLYHKVCCNCVPRLASPALPDVCASFTLLVHEQVHVPYAYPYSNRSTAVTE